LVIVQTVDKYIELAEAEMAAWDEAVQKGHPGYPVSLAHVTEADELAMRALIVQMRRHWAQVVL
jgi:hypothetical protein